jgi:hypothetical protein
VADDRSAARSSSGAVLRGGASSLVGAARSASLIELGFPAAAGGGGGGGCVSEVSEGMP